MRPLLPLLVASLLAPAAATFAAPENAVGELLSKARAADALKRVPPKSFFAPSKRDRLLIYFELKVRGDDLRTEMVEYSRDGRWKGERSALDFRGALKSITRATGRDQREPAPEDLLRGEPKDGKLEFTTGAGQPQPELTQKLEGPTISMGVALFVLPALYDLLPTDPLPLIVVVDARAMPIRLVRGKAEAGVQQVLLQGPKGLELAVHVSTAEGTKGRVLQIVVDGQVTKALGEAEAEKLLKEFDQAAGGGAAPKGYPTPRAAVEALIAACAAKDLQAAGACFAAEAPKEFQSLRDGTCPPQSFAGFCQMFAGASVDSIEMGKDGKATVAIRLPQCKRETVKVLKGAEGWLILDF
ncbi:MAG: hypothetical protein AB7N76_11330 [Planctomycetota bacterium]